MPVQCFLVAAIAAVAISVPVTQEEYARYIAQQQTQRLEDKQPEKGQPIRKPVLFQVVPSGNGAYPQPAAPRPAYQQPAAYQSQAAAQQALAYQPQPAYQPQAYAQPSYQSPQAYQQPEEYQQPEQQYQPAIRPQAPRPKVAPKPKVSNRPEKPEDEENDNNVSV